MKSGWWWMAFALWSVPVALLAQTRPGIDVGPEPTLRIGGGLNEPPERSFTDIAAISVIGDSILVLEEDAKEIRIFDHRGGFLGRIGRPGEGPGEFDWPTAMWLSPEGITVVDLKLRRQSFFSRRGELIRTEILGALPGQPLAGSAQLRGGAVVMETAITMSSEGAFPERLIIMREGKTTASDTIARYSTGYVPFRTAGAYGFLSANAGSEGDWAVVGDSLLVVASSEPTRVRWWRANGAGIVLAGEVALPIRPEPFTREDVHELIEKTNEANRAEGGPPLPRSASVDAPEFWGQVKQLVIADSEKVWIQWDRPRSDEDHHWFRINLHDRQVERVELPSGFRMLAAQAGKLYGFRLTEYDVPVLTVYPLRPK